MEIEVVKELITAFKEANLSRLSLKCEDFELKLEKGNSQVENIQAAMPQMTGYPVSAAQNPAEGNLLPKAEAMEEERSRKIPDKVIKSPIVGTFYSASAPGEAPFVTVGTKVKKGDIVCVIEAMKLMNEVEAEEDGEIIEILVENEEMVEYGQPLFVLG